MPQRTPNPDPRTPACILPLQILFTLLCALLPAPAQDFSTSQQAQPDPHIAAANAALAAHDYATALQLLTPLAAAGPKDPHILYDLASAQDALDQSGPAEASYRAAIAADPNLLQPRVALGLLLARNAHLPEARTEFAYAVSLPDADPALKARALRALARIDQSSRPADARDELLAALQLSPETPQDTLLSAELAASANGGAPAAEAAYRRLLVAEPANPDAALALAHLFLQQHRIPEAQALLTSALAAHPNDPALTVQLATLYAANGQPTQALALAEPLHHTDPRDATLTHLLAQLYLEVADYAHAEPLLAQLTTQNPQDPTLAGDYGDALIHLRRYAEAQAILTRALAQPSLFPTPGTLADVAFRLAFAASENNDPAVVLQAIATRATVSAPSATILFLAAISQDKLHHVKLARQAYEQFLAAANGTLPDQEFEAKHRLVALEHMK